MSNQVFNPNQVLLGTYGKLFVNNEVLANVSEFEVKSTYDFADVAIAGSLTKGKKIAGVTIEGTFKLSRTDLSLAKSIHQSYSKGDVLDVKLIGELDDPSSKNGAIRVAVRGVVFTEATLLSFVNGEIGEDEFPFTATEVEYL